MCLHVFACINCVCFSCVLSLCFLAICCCSLVIFIMLYYLCCTVLSRISVVSCSRTIKWPVWTNCPTLLCTVWVKKIPPEDLWQFLQNGWEFFSQILHAYYVFLCALDYEFLFNYLQLWRSYTILSVTTQFTSCVQNVHHRPKRMLAFSDIFPKQLGIFSPNFRCLLSSSIMGSRSQMINDPLFYGLPWVMTPLS